MLDGKRQWRCVQYGETNTLDFLCWNIAGLASKLTDPDFISYVCGLDALVETFLDKSFESTDHFPNVVTFQASVVKLAHHGRRSGGVVVLLKKRLMNFVHEIETTYGHIICLKLSNTLLATYSGVLYIAAFVPPIMLPYYNASVDSCHIEQTEHCMLDFYEGHGAMPVIV